MSGLALALVLGSAVIHASWNLLAKRAAGASQGVGGAAVFTWLFATLTVLAYAPVVAAFVFWTRPTFTTSHALLALGSSVLHVGYFVALQRGYRVGDLSVVYPLARGSGPALATLLAVVFLAERPGTQAIAGTALVVLGVFVLSAAPLLLPFARRRGGTRPQRSDGLPGGVFYGLLTGAFIGAYTVWDGHAVAVVGAAPLLFSYASEVGRAVVLTPLALYRPKDVRAAWRANAGPALGIALLSPLAYLMVLSAMTFTPVSLVAPTREISILIGTMLGTRLLAEGQGRRRLAGAAAMLVGVVLLATSHG